MTVCLTRLVLHYFKEFNKTPSQASIHFTRNELFPEFSCFFINNVGSEELPSHGWLVAGASLFISFFWCQML